MFLILSYCDTIKKKQILKDLISSLKDKFPGRKIMVYSHYQDIDPDYYRGSDYYLYDHTNPTVDVYGFVWRYVPALNKKITRKGGDRGYAVLSMVKRGCTFLKSIGEEEVTILNYDFSTSDVTQEIINLREERNQHEVAIFNKWGEPNSVNLILFHLSLKDINYDFFQSITPEKYRSYNFIPAESIAYNIFKENFDGRFRIVEKNISPAIDSWNNNLPGSHYLTKYFDSIALTTELGKNPDNKYISLYETKERIASIDIVIGGENFNIINQLDDVNSQGAFFSPLPAIEITEVCLAAINGNPIDPHWMENLNYDFWINNYHE